VLLHIVLISFRPHATPERREATLLEYSGLGEKCGGSEAGILFWRVGPNLDQRKDWHLVELAIFRDDAALEHYRRHPAHAEATAGLREIADWAVGDLCLKDPKIADLFKAASSLR
jgi:hypothetical protein